MSLEIWVEVNGTKYSGTMMTIDRTRLGWSRDGCFFDTWLHCSGDSVGIGVGGYVLDDPVPVGSGERAPTKFGMAWIMRTMRVLGVESWEEIKGKRVVVLFKKAGGWGQTAVGIANPDTGDAMVFEEYVKDWSGKIE